MRNKRADQVADYDWLRGRNDGHRVVSDYFRSYADWLCPDNLQLLQEGVKGVVRRPEDYDAACLRVRNILAVFAALLHHSLLLLVQAPLRQISSVLHMGFDHLLGWLVFFTSVVVCNLPRPQRSHYNNADADAASSQEGETASPTCQTPKQDGQRDQLRRPGHRCKLPNENRCDGGFPTLNAHLESVCQSRAAV